MGTTHLQSIALALVAILCVALAPAIAFAQPGAEATNPPKVTLEQMKRSAPTDQDKKGERLNERDVGAQQHSDSQRSDAQEDDSVREPSAGSPTTNWAQIIGQNALWGGITGGLIGFGAWLVTGRDFSPWAIAQFAGGGLLIGATIGAISLAVHTDRYARQAQGIVPRAIGPAIYLKGQF